LSPASGEGHLLQRQAEPFGRDLRLGGRGAHASRGSGLSGIERRLEAFDGILALSSPPGGPTVVRMELPCELSSPKTSSY
jgi:hypothetical protein